MTERKWRLTAKGRAIAGKRAKQRSYVRGPWPKPCPKCGWIHAASADQLCEQLRTKKDRRK